MVLSMFNRDLVRKEHWIFGVVAVFATVGLVCSLILSIEKLQLLANPHTQLPCSLNAFLNCATVMNTPESSLLGFPNSFIGMMAYSVLLTVTVEILFAYWLFFDSVFAIKVLCPFCLAVTFSSTMIFAAVTRYNILEKNLCLSPKTQATLEKWMNKGYDKVFVAGWVVAMIALVLVRFPGIFSS